MSVKKKTKKTAMPDIKQLTPAQKAKAILGAAQKGKAAYRIVDVLLDELVKEVGVDTPIDCGTSGMFRVADQFAARSYASKTVYVSRYKLEEV